MSFASILSDIAGVAGAPFTGGASLIPVLGNVASSIIGAGAAGKAADAQVAGEQKVLDLTNKTIPQANDLIGSGVAGANGTLATTYGEDKSLLSPYMSTGTNALNHLNTLVNGGGFQAPTGVTEQNDPGYQFRLQQGQQALERSAAARGGALGGGAAKDLESFAQGEASNEYGNTYNRALQGYQTNFGNLNSLAGLGLSATNTGVGASNLTGTQTAGNTLQGASLQSGNLLQGLGISADALTGAANARASGYVGTANAVNNGITNSTNSISNMALLNRLLQGQQYNAPAGQPGGNPNINLGLDVPDVPPLPYN